MRLALAQLRVTPAHGVAAWSALLGRRLDEAEGAEFVVLPEYAAVEAAAGAADLAGELRAAVDMAPALVEAMRAAAAARSIWLLGGSLPMRVGDEVRNRAPLIDSSGKVAWQEKRVMTRFERERWGIAPGAPPAVFETRWGRIGVAICYDVEFPALVRAQVEAGAWLILAPACTDSLAGFNRVRLAARARALENQCYVAVAPMVGDAPGLATLDVNRGYAAVFSPVDRGFPEDGVLARGAMDEPGFLRLALDPARLDAARADGAVRQHRDWPDTPPPCPVRLPA